MDAWEAVRTTIWAAAENPQSIKTFQTTESVPYWNGHQQVSTVQVRLNESGKAHRRQDQVG
jgi:hypothetical protein